MKVKPSERSPGAVGYGVVGLVAIARASLLRERRPHRTAAERSHPTGRINSWKTILNALTIHYGDRIEAVNSQ